MDNSAVMYNADYQKRLPAEPQKLRKAGCSAMHDPQNLMIPYALKSALLSLITLSIYILMNVPYNYNTDYRKQLPAEPHKLWKDGCYPVHASFEHSHVIHVSGNQQI